MKNAEDLPQMPQGGDSDELTDADAGTDLSTCEPNSPTDGGVPKTDVWTTTLDTISADSFLRLSARHYRPSEPDA